MENGRWPSTTASKTSLSPTPPRISESTRSRNPFRLEQHRRRLRALHHGRTPFLHCHRTRLGRRGSLRDGSRERSPRPAKARRRPEQHPPTRGILRTPAHRLGRSRAKAPLQRPKKNAGKGQAHPRDLLGLDHTRLTHRFQGRDFRLTDVSGEVVTKLLA